MTPFAIGGLQLNTSGLRDNLPYMTAKLDYFMYLFPWVQMVVFSELATYGPNPAKAEPLPGPAERKFQDLAAKHKIWLINGSLVESLNGKHYNTLSVIDPTGAETSPPTDRKRYHLPGRKALEIGLNRSAQTFWTRRFAGIVCRTDRCHRGYRPRSRLTARWGRATAAHG